MDVGSTEANAAVQRRVRRAARSLTLRTREYVAETARETRLPDVDIHAVGVLRAAALEGRTVTAGELGRELSLSAGAVTALVNRMERAGHVVRRRSAVDRRSVTIHVTDHAVEMSTAMFDPLVEVYGHVLDEYDVRDLALVADVLERLAESTAVGARHLHQARREADIATTTEANP